MIKLYKMDKTTSETKTEVMTFDLSDQRTAGDAAKEMAKTIFILDSKGYCQSNVYDREDVHILEYTLWDEYPVRNMYISGMIQRFDMTYQQARRAYMRTIGMTLGQIADKEGISISAVNDSIKLANDKIRKGCD